MKKKKEGQKEDDGEKEEEGKEQKDIFTDNFASLRKDSRSLGALSIIELGIKKICTNSLEVGMNL